MGEEQRKKSKRVKRVKKVNNWINSTKRDDGEEEQRKQSKKVKNVKSMTRAQITKNINTGQMVKRGTMGEKSGGKRAHEYKS